MDVNEILSGLDSLLKACRLDEAEEYMNKRLEEARGAGRTDIEITLLNEQAGFYRDCGRFDDSLSCCRKSEELLDVIGEGDTPRRAAAMLNSANALRAAGLINEAYEHYGRIDALLAGINDDGLRSGYLNNLSLLHQEAGRWDDARDCLEKALEIAERPPADELRSAISRSNLAVCLIRLGDTAAAREVLSPAMEIFIGRSPSDFHYSAALAAMGDILFAEGSYADAAGYYEAALSEIELHMGHNNFYNTVSDNLERAYKEAGGKPAIKGAELCRRYFETFGRPMLKRNFPEYLDKIACGLAGEGSDCLGFDDELSADHDFGPAFVIWTDDGTYEAVGRELQAAYDALPRSYMGIKRVATPQGAGRTGVMRVSDFLERFTGCSSVTDVPETVEQWLAADDSLLACAVNGAVWMDNSGDFEDIRRRIRTGQPEQARLKKLAQQLALAAQSGQYNYPRAVKRGDSAAALTCLSDFIAAAARAAHILCGVYAPYSKWLYKSAEGLPRLSGISPLINEIAEGREITDNIDRICSMLAKEARAQLLTDSTDSYLGVIAESVSDFADRISIAERIIAIEWERFDKVENEGGRADCQDDSYTFFIMRRSQYYTWPMELLRSLLADFEAALADGRNPITEKYGYMMRSTAPERFAEIKDKLPDVPAEKAAVIDAVAAVQVGWMEDFAARYPRLAGQARLIHTYEDTPSQTSYETYLRGELSTYSDITLKMYGGFIVDIHRSGGNLAEAIMERSVRMYGYKSLDEAENSV